MTGDASGSKNQRALKDVLLAARHLTGGAALLQRYSLTVEAFMPCLSVVRVPQSLNNPEHKRIIERGERRKATCQRTRTRSRKARRSKRAQSPPPAPKTLPITPSKRTGR